MAVTCMDGRASRTWWVCIEVWRSGDGRGTVGVSSVTPNHWMGGELWWVWYPGCHTREMGEGDGWGLGVPI